MATLSRLLLALVVALSVAVLPRVAHAARETYPLDADDFREEIEKRIARTKSAVDQKLERNGVSAARRTEIRHLVDDVSRDVKNALDRATADNGVTRDEARHVRDLAKGLRGKIRARLRVESDTRKSRKSGKDDDAAPHKKSSKSDKAKKGEKAERGEKSEKAEKGESASAHRKSDDGAAKHGKNSDEPKSTPDANTSPKSASPYEGG